MTLTDNFIRAYWNIGQRSKQCSRQSFRNNIVRTTVTLITVLQENVLYHSVTLQEAQLMLTKLRDAFGGQSRTPNIVLEVIESCTIQ